VVVLTELLSEQGEGVKELHHAVVAEYPLLTASMTKQDAHLVTEAAVVAKGLVGENKAPVDTLNSVRA